MSKHRRAKRQRGWPNPPPLPQPTPEQQAMLAEVHRLEAAIYPPALLVLRDMQSWADLVDFCEGKPGLMVWESGYLLCAADQIADWARLPGKPMPPGRFRACLRFMAEYYAGYRRVGANCRDSTSYPLFRHLEEKGYLRIHSAEPHRMGGEGFHYLTLTFLPKALAA